jgi:transposase
MERFIGIDVHKDSSTVAVMGPSGKKIRCDVVETNGAVLVEMMKQIPGKRHLCIEETLQSGWLREVLHPHVEEIVIEGTTERRDRSRPKTDEADAWGLAERLRTGAVKNRVYKAPRELEALREAVLAYGLVMRDLVRVKNRLRAVYRSRGISVDGEDIYRAGRREEQQAKLSPGKRMLVEMMVQQLDVLETLAESAEKRVEEEAGAHRAVARLKTAPGFGPIRAAQVLAFAMTPHRFRTTRQFWSYCGLSIVMRTSSDWVRENGRWIRSDNAMKTRGLTCRRQPVLKNVFKGAAHTVVGKMKEHPLACKYQQMCEAGTKPSLAMLTIARKIAGAVFAMWKHEEDYDPERQVGRPPPA